MTQPELMLLTATEAATRIASGALTARDYMKACLACIAVREPEVQAFIHLDPEYALKQAAERDAWQASGRPLGPLHGVPVGIKDIIDTADFPTESGTAALAGSAVELIHPLPYPDMVRLMDAAHLILSDSGGLQEEAPALGVPLLVLRENTERPEALAAGNIALVGTDPDRIAAAAARLLDDPAAYMAMARPAFPYGRGDAAEKILDAIEGWIMDGALNN